MRVLFTGASSFTGCWFARDLAAAGHEIVAVFPRAEAEYEGGRADRVSLLAGSCERLFSITFGDDAFQELIRTRDGWDLLCHHAACVKGYHRPDFDIAAALAMNTYRLREMLLLLREKGAKRILLTGSVFEKGEGRGTDGLPSFSPYGVSKALTSAVFEYTCAALGMRLGKFVIANPFGPFEEPRFTSYLARTWCAGETAGCRTPDYVRDNIHVSLLSKAYVSFAESLPDQPGFVRYGPSGYAETQGAFAERFAAAMRPRLALPCTLLLQKQTEWGEPKERTNTDPVDTMALGFSEDAAWDELARWYRLRFGGSAHA